jgi:hypothetical protein
MLSMEHHNPVVNREARGHTYIERIIFRNRNFNSYAYRAASNNNFAFLRSRIHERTISLRFLGIIFKVSDLRFLYGFLKPMGRGYIFLSGFPPFSFTETVRGCVSLKK